jgi:hypothetical protein
MSIALPTITLVLIIAPGLIFRRFYYTGEFSKEFFKSNFSDLVFSAVVPSFLIHGLLYFPIHYTNTIDFDLLSILFSGTSEVKDIGIAFSKIEKSLTLIVSYFLLAFLLSAVLGLTLKFIVRKFKLDRKLNLLRFKNEWHYLFSGEILDFPNVSGNADEISFSVVDAMVESSEGSLLYSGILSSYVLNKDSGIDRIYLSDVKRRFLKDDKKDAYYKMPGEFFVLPFDTIVNLHITYYSVELSDMIDKDIEEQLVD